MPRSVSLAHSGCSFGQGASICFTEAHCCCRWSDFCGRVCPWSRLQLHLPWPPACPFTKLRALPGLPASASGSSESPPRDGFVEQSIETSKCAETLQWEGRARPRDPARPLGWSRGVCCGDLGGRGLLELPLFLTASKYP